MGRGAKAEPSRGGVTAAIKRAAIRSSDGAGLDRAYRTDPPSYQKGSSFGVSAALKLLFATVAIAGVCRLWTIWPPGNSSSNDQGQDASHRAKMVSPSPTSERAAMEKAR